VIKGSEKCSGQTSDYLNFSSADDGAPVWPSGGLAGLGAGPSGVEGDFSRATSLLTAVGFGVSDTVSAPDPPATLKVSLVSSFGPSPVAGVSNRGFFEPDSSAGSAESPLAGVPGDSLATSTISSSLPASTAEMLLACAGFSLPPISTSPSWSASVSFRNASSSSSNSFRFWSSPSDTFPASSLLVAPVSLFALPPAVSLAASLPPGPVSGVMLPDPVPEPAPL